MSASRKERRITQRVEEAPAGDLDNVRQVNRREIGVRFIAGAATSIVAGVLTLSLGARVGGIMLAFPAILAASLTLIAQEEDTAQAREDARGAVVGACALGAFAGVCAFAFDHWDPAVVLLVATAVWTGVALGGYLLFWFRSSQR